MLWLIFFGIRSLQTSTSNTFSHFQEKHNACLRIIILWQIAVIHKRDLVWFKKKKIHAKFFSHPSRNNRSLGFELAALPSSFFLSRAPKIWPNTSLFYSPLPPAIVCLLAAIKLLTYHVYFVIAWLDGRIIALFCFDCAMPRELVFKGAKTEKWNDK